MLCALSAMAVDVDDSGVWRIKVKDDGTILLVGFTYSHNHTGDSLIIPSQLRFNNTTYNVTEIGDTAFVDKPQFYKGQIRGHLIIPEGIVKIGWQSFLRCQGLTGPLQLPSTLKIIGPEAFNRVGLTGDIVIPEGVTSIGVGAFYRCLGFTGTLTLPSTLRKLDFAAFFDCQNLTGDIVIPEGVDSISDLAFRNCLNMNGTLTLPSTATYIGTTAFGNCRKLKGDVRIPDGVTHIGDSAFMNCAALDGVLTLPASLTTVGTAAFRSCINLKGGITFPSTVTKIGPGAFMSCRSLSYADLTQVPASVFPRVETRKTTGAVGIFAGLPPCPMIYFPAGVTVEADQENFVVGDRCENFVVYDKWTSSNVPTFTMYAKYVDYPILHPFTATKANYKNRATFNDHDTYTSYLPYPSAIPQGMKAYEVKLTTADTQHIIFKQIAGNTLQANTPYLLRLDEDQTQATYAEMANVFVPASPRDVFDRADLTQPAAALGWKFLGTTIALQNTVAAEHRAHLLGANQTWKPISTTSTGGYIHPMRAFVQAPVGGGAAPMAFFLEDNELISSIDAIQTQVQDKQVDIYTIEGKYVGRDYNALPKGLYIVGGQKIYKF